jgi:hypothetical protein
LVDFVGAEIDPNKARGRENGRADGAGQSGSVYPSIKSAIMTHLEIIETINQYTIIEGRKS